LNNVSVSTNIDISDKVLDRISVFCTKLLQGMDKKDWEVSILLCDDQYIKDLNNRYRKIDKPTDVLSFPQDDCFLEHDKVYAGDIAVSMETCAKQAHENGITKEDELKQLLIHGVLHLSGMNHETETDYSNMYSKQEELLSLMTGETLL